MKINWLKALGYGAIMYVVAFMVVSGFLAYKVDTKSLLVGLVTDVIVYGLGIYLATKLEMKDRKEAALYGVVWVATLFVLDFLFTKPFAGAGYFNNPQVWVSYVIVFLLPQVGLYLKSKKS